MYVPPKGNRVTIELLIDDALHGHDISATPRLAGQFVNVWLSLGKLKKLT